MKNRNSKVTQVLSAALILSSVAFYGCNVDRTQRGRAPDVDVDVDPGRLPRYDIEGPDVKVGTAERTVTVPELVWVERERKIEVPYIDIDVPGADKEERTIAVDVQVPNPGYNLQIQEVRAAGGKLWVVSKLTDTGGAASTRNRKAVVSDRVVINAPGDLNVQHIIIGEKPEGDYNDQYTFVADQNAVQQRAQGGRVLYSRNT